MSAQAVIGGAFAAITAAAIYSHFSQPQEGVCRPRALLRLHCVSELIAIVTMHPPQSAAPDPAAKGLKRTLTNGGLYPQPAGAAGKGKLQTRPSGSMAVFTEGGSALGGAESGAHN